MKATPEIVAHGKAIADIAGRLANGDAGEQFHILLQALVSFAPRYSAAERLLETAVDSLSAARDAARQFAKDHAS